MPKVTFPWEQFEDVHHALVSRGYSHRINKRGVTIEWDEPEISEARVRNLIGTWIAADQAEAAFKNKAKQKGHANS